MVFSADPLLAGLVQDAAAAAVAFETVARPLAVAAGLAVVVERVLELLKNAADLVPGPPGRTAGRHAGRLAEPIDRLERFHRAESTRAEAEERRARLVALEAAAHGAPLTGAERHEIDELRALLRAPGHELRALEPDEAFPPETLVVQDATDADGGGALRALTLQLVAAALGILAARVFDVRLFDALTPTPLAGGAPTDYLLTGLLIGGGSGPVHVLIRFIGERKVTLPEPVDRDEDVAVHARPRALSVAEQALLSGPMDAGPAVIPRPGTPAAPAAPAITVPDTAWIEIPYRGGVDRDALESVHRRRADPDTIIYHHTAMHRSSTFDDVVRVVRDRRDARGNPWITGYNCVITGDGAVHPFCRWDRYGNHAAGWNARSLGIALNGNFETDPAVPYSNPDGRYGPARPSEPQLEAAARVVALWAIIYGIPPDFGTRIIPHRQVAGVDERGRPRKACPGGGFPYHRFEALVRRFHEAWTAGPDRARVEAFDRLPYLHV